MTPKSLQILAAMLYLSSVRPDKYKLMLTPGAWNLYERQVFWWRPLMILFNKEIA